MSYFDSFRQAPAKHFANGLLEPKPRVVPRRWGLVAILLLACFVPRAWIACHWDLVWTDSVTFLHAAQAIERGDRHAALEETGLNIYPVILYGARRLGLNWTVAGTWWSVLMATLAVLPLFGWVRRQFDDQVATFACLAYGFHGKLMAVSVLIIRDATFWFLFNLTIYLLWRAATEVRWRWFLAASLGLTLAVHTRSEGWLLTVPLILWPAFRLAAAPNRRATLIGGIVVCLAVVPLCLAAVNLTWLRSAPHWCPLREAHVEIVERWLGGESPAGPTNQASQAPPASASVAQPKVTSQPAPKAAPAPPPPAVDLDPLSFAPVRLDIRLRKFGETLVKAYTYLLGLFALIGVTRWWRTYLRRDHQTLLVMVVVLLGMIWVRNTQVRGDIRYFFPMVLVSFPWIALGFLQVAEWAAWLATWGGRRVAAVRPVMITAMAAAVIVFGMCDTNLASTGFMRAHADLGRWIKAHFGPNRTIMADITETRLVEYYARGQVTGYLDPASCPPTGIPQVLRDLKPDVLLLWTDQPGEDRWLRLAARIMADRQLAYRIVYGDDLPDDPDEVIVLTRVRRIP